MREALNGRPAAERTRRDYQRVADAFRKVYYVAPASTKADASVIAVAELLAEMGRQFPNGDKDLHASIGQYEFLRKEYPGSKYRVEALFTIGQIYKQDLGSDDAAREAFQEFLKRYPRSHLAPDARQALAELKQPKPRKQVAPAGQAAPVAEDARNTADPTDPNVAIPSSPASVAVPMLSKSGATLVTGVRHWSSADYTRVAIDVDGPVQYQAGRVPDPDRIFFDLPETKLASTLVGKSFDVQDGFLRKIRVAQYQRGSTRVVLEVDDVSEYSAFLLPNPYRLIIDIHGRQPHAQTSIASASPAPAADEATPGDLPERTSRSMVAGNVASDSTTAAKRRGVPKPPSLSKPEQKAAKAQTELATATISPGSTKPIPRKVVEADDDSDEPPASSLKSDEPTSSDDRATPPIESLNRGNASSGKVKDRPVSTKQSGKNPLIADAGDAPGPELKATSHPTTAPTAVEVSPRGKDTRKSGKTLKAEISAGREAAPTSAGDRSLIRALGLKIGRIVIDAGHGGHDTGTIGPNGLLEKDLVLDVALRLGRLLETRLGADVIFTRDDDTFIPLETRTAVANQHEADLFVSIHANSSRDSSARGVETYYLNFTSDPGALEVAARENAVSEKSVHELQDLVKKITLKEKIEESRELASDVQQSLYSGLAVRNPSLRNRGVKKAPFVVLIGANMPSILAEISFVSNPADEKKLETPEYRQKIADSLYKGVAKYASGLSGVKVASKFNRDSGQ